MCTAQKYLLYQVSGVSDVHEPVPMSCARVASAWVLRFALRRPRPVRHCHYSSYFVDIAARVTDTCVSVTMFYQQTSNLSFSFVLLCLK